MIQKIAHYRDEVLIDDLQRVKESTPALGGIQEEQDLKHLAAMKTRQCYLVCSLFAVFS
jgi:hypothetical protein